MDLPPPTPSLADSISLLRHATASISLQHLPERDTHFQSDTFPVDASVLNQAIRSHEGQVTER